MFVLQLIYREKLHNGNSKGKRFYLMKLAKTMILFASVTALSGCGLFESNTQESSASEESQVESVSSSAAETPVSNESSASQESEANASSSEGEAEASETSSSETATSQEDQVAALLAEVKNDVADSYVALLPTGIPLLEDTYPTAYTSEEDGAIKVHFYQTVEPVAYGDSALEDGAYESDKIADVTIRHYASEAEAASQISQIDYQAQGGMPVDLGYDISGYQDGAAGHVNTSWNEGRWDFSVQALNNSGEDTGVKMATEIVDYLEVNMLPAPQQYGMGRFSTEGLDGNFLSYQVGSSVITIDGGAEPLTILNFASYFE